MQVEVFRQELDAIVLEMKLLYAKQSEAAAIAAQQHAAALQQLSLPEQSLPCWRPRWEATKASRRSTLG